MGWSKCIICQEDNSETLKCPLDSLGAGGEAFHSSFLSNVERFHSIRAFVYFGCDVTADDLKMNYASWHKSCHLKCSSSKLSRTKKKESYL